MRLKLGIATRIQSITVTALIGIAAVVGLSILQLREEVVDAQMVKTQHVVETAYGFWRITRRRSGPGA
jgi:methyl-accepting chemotaxis protein